jgi:RNA polymerase sigma-70 factor (ECF subfamily)
VDASGAAAVADAVGRAARGGRLAVVAALVRATGDFELAEDCWQDALERALTRWPAEGIPTSPEAWLSVVARNRALDILRRRRTERDKLPELLEMTRHHAPAPGTGASAYDDDRLKLLFACCHPALPPAGRVALTLKTVAGLSTREVARAFLVSEATMSQRLLRAKTKIAHAAIPLRVPPAGQLADRVEGVLAVVYLLFNEGHQATQGEPLRGALTREALELGTLLIELLPEHDEARGLLALMLLQDSRRHARIDSSGELVPIDEQDRGLWDRSQIATALRILTAPSPSTAPGPYRLHAAIAALHATAPRAERTDWTRIVQAYDALLNLQDSPVIALNRLIALSFRDGPQCALAQLPALEDALAGYPPLAAARADFLRRAGRAQEAAAAYRVAIDQARTDAERRSLQRRLTEVGAGPL